MNSILFLRPNKGHAQRVESINMIEAISSTLLAALSVYLS